MYKNKNRMEQILLTDKLQETNSFTDVIKSDIYNIISDYFDIIDKTLDINIKLNNYDLYEISINLKADKIKRAYIPK